jgi:hypothetical protein
MGSAHGVFCVLTRWNALTPSLRATLLPRAGAGPGVRAIEAIATRRIATHHQRSVRPSTAQGAGFGMRAPAKTLHLRGSHTSRKLWYNQGASQYHTKPIEHIIYPIGIDLSGSSANFACARCRGAGFSGRLYPPGHSRQRTWRMRHLALLRWHESAEVVLV